VRVKFCGITNLDDAAEAVRLGAWAIGLIHYDRSPRYVEPATAAEIAAAYRRKCEVVGAVVDCGCRHFANCSASLPTL